MTTKQVINPLTNNFDLINEIDLSNKIDKTGDEMSGELTIMDLPIKENLLNTLGTGVTSKITLSKVTDTTFSITDGSGIIVDSSNNNFTEVNWTGYNNVTDLYPLSDITYILINSTGNIIQLTTAPTPQQYRNNILIGAIGKNQGLIIFNRTIALPAFDGINAITDLARFLGALQDGNIKIQGTSALSINYTAGTILSLGANMGTSEYNPNFVQLAAKTPAIVNMIYRNSIGGWTIGADTTLITVNKLDTGDGLLGTTLNNNKWSNLVVYLSSTGKVYIQYGQVAYNSITSAINGITTESRVDWPYGNTLVRLGYITIRAGATATNNSSDCVLTNLGKFGTGGSSGDSISGIESYNFEALTGQKQLLSTDATNQVFTVTGNQNLILPATATAGKKFRIQQATYGVNYLIVKIAAGNEIDRVYNNTTKEYLFNGTSWVSGNGFSGGQETEAGGNITIGSQALSYAGGVAIGKNSNGYTEGVGIGFGANGGSRGVAIGGSSNGANNGVAVGKGANTNGNGSTAVGYSAVAQSTGAVALGNTANANTSYCVAIGAGANGANGLAIGKEANTRGVTGRFSRTVYLQPTNQTIQQSYGHSISVANTATAITSTNGTPSASNQLVLQNNSTCSFHGIVQFRKQSDGTISGAFEVKGVAIRGATAGTTQIIGSTVTNIGGTTDKNVTIIADTTSGAIQIQANNGASGTDVYLWSGFINGTETSAL